MLNDRRRLVPLPARVFLVLLTVAGLLAWQYLRPIPALAASRSLPSSMTVPGTAPVLPWPSSGEAAVAATGVGVIGTSGGESRLPMYSVAKIMTALVVLGDHPLKKDETGPAITVDDAAVADYTARQANQESVVKVAKGEQISEYDALQALLIPSGNNIAALLARWDAGSLAAFVTKMNARAQAMGLTQTHFDDPAGVQETTAATPRDLVALAQVAMQDEVFAGVVVKTAATVPVAGLVFNVDYIIGQEGIVGVKTGSSPNGSSNFVFAATHNVSGTPVLIVGAVMIKGTLAQAFDSSKALVHAVKAGLVSVRLFTARQTVGHYSTPWGSGSDVIVTKDLDLLAWPGQVARFRMVTHSARAPLAAGAPVGTILVQLDAQGVRLDLVTADPVDKATTRWRLTRGL